MMHKLWIPCLALAWLVTSCQYQEPLVAHPELELDHALIGSWTAIPADKNDDEMQDSMSILPFSDKEYMVIYRSNGGEMYFRAYRGEAAGIPLVQLQWLGHDGKAIKADDKPYQVCQYKVEGDTLTFSLLNKEVVASDTTEAMVSSLASNTENPKLFAEPVSFQRIH